MHASEMEFARSEQLRLRAFSTARTDPPAVRPNRQGGFFILRSALKRLPLCSAIAAAAIRLAAQLLPPEVRRSAGVWSAGALAVGLAVGTAVLSWARCRWELNDNHLHLRRGVVAREDISLPLSGIVSVELRQTPTAALFGSAGVCIRTALRTRRPVRLLMNRRAAAMMAGQLLPGQKLTLCRRGRVHSYRADYLSILAGAFSGEGLAAFIPAAAAVLTALHDLAALQPAEELLQLISHRIAVPAAVAAFGLFWCAKIIHTLLTCARMTVSRSGGTVTLSRGVVIRRSDIIRLRDVSGIDIRHPLPLMPFGRRSCSLLVRSGESCPLLPPVDERRLRIETAALAPHGSRVCAVLPMSSPLAYACGRWLACLAVPPMVSLLRNALPFLSSTLYAAGIIAAVTLLWRAFVTTISAARAGVRVFSDCVEITGVHRLTMRTLRVFRPAVGMIRITQGPFSRLSARCTVTVTPRGKGERQRCIKLPFERALAVCERLM